MLPRKKVLLPNLKSTFRLFRSNPKQVLVWLWTSFVLLLNHCSTRKRTKKIGCIHLYYFSFPLLQPFFLLNHGSEPLNDFYYSFTLVWDKFKGSIKKREHKSWMVRELPCLGSQCLTPEVSTAGCHHGIISSKKREGKVGGWVISMEIWLLFGVIWECFWGG